MNEYEILDERNLDLVAFIRADTYIEAREIAERLGYDLEYYRVEEAEY